MAPEVIDKGFRGYGPPVSTIWQHQYLHKTSTSHQYLHFFNMTPISIDVLQFSDIWLLWNSCQFSNTWVFYKKDMDLWSSLIIWLFKEDSCCLMCMSLIWHLIVSMLCCQFHSWSQWFEQCILLHTGVTATKETSVVKFVGFHWTQTHLEGGNCYADVIIFKLFTYCSNFDFEYIYGWGGFVKNCSKRTRKKITCVPYYIETY